MHPPSAGINSHSQRNTAHGSPGTFFSRGFLAEGHGTAAVETALIQGAMMRSRGLDPEQHIKNIQIGTTAAVDWIINKRGMLNNAADWDHCMQYLVALALLKDATPEAHDFQDGSL